MAVHWAARLGEAFQRYKFVQFLLFTVVTASVTQMWTLHVAHGLPVDRQRARHSVASGQLSTSDDSPSAVGSSREATLSKRGGGGSQGLTKAMEMFQNLRRMLSERMLIASSLTANGDSDEHVDIRKSAAHDDHASSTLTDRDTPKRGVLFDSAQYAAANPGVGVHRHRQRHSRTHHHNSHVQSSTESSEHSAAAPGKLSLGEFRINANLHLSSDLDEEDADDSAPLVEVTPTSSVAPGGGGGSSRRQRFKFLEIGREAERKLQATVTLAANAYECPRVHGKITQLLCPSRRLHGYRVCIDESALCNGKPDCPYGEDEDAVSCLFYKTTMRYFKTVVDTVVELTDVVFRQKKHMEL